MLRALEHFDAGWKPTKIRQLLGDEGLGSPSVNTIYQWVNPEYRERHRQSMRERKRRETALNAAFRLRSDTEEYRLAFMRALRAERVSCHGIAKVCRVVFGARMSEQQVRVLLGEAGSVRLGASS
jgi:sugar phosphate isomerase/epimerase